MARNRNEKQFDEYRDWQWIKHLILKEYAFLWSMILGPHNREIVVVDTCAGAGSYTDPDTGEAIGEGSPVIFGRRAMTYTQQNGPGRSMRVICCEQNRNNYRSLVEAVRPFEPHVTTLHGKFRRFVPRIAEEIGNAPALILLDPIGVATIPADSWKPFLERRGKTDLFFVLHFAGVHRVGGWLLSNGEPNPDIAPARRGVSTIDRVFNSREWRNIAVDESLSREAKERWWVKLFFEHVIADRHEWKCYCEVKARYTSPVKYWLVHASNDRKPYTLMNDEITKVNEMLLRREYSSEGLLDGFVDADISAHQEHIEREIAVAVFEYLREAPGGTLPYGAIEDKLLRRFFGRAMVGANGPNVHWRVVKALIKGDKLLREKRKIAAADPLETISLPRPPAEGEGAKVVSISSGA
jgi:three-Cys-motif partner protein